MCTLGAILYALGYLACAQKFNMAANRKRLNLDEVIDTFLADEDSEADNILLQNEEESLDNQDSEWEYGSTTDGR